MIIGIGVDIIEIERIRSSVEKFGDNFLNRIFTQVELDYSLPKKNKFLHLAARFAAKEAIVKALATCCEKGFNWKDIEITNNISGAPNVIFYGKFAEFIANDKEVLISLSHTENYATAFAILQSKN